MLGLWLHRVKLTTEVKVEEMKGGEILTIVYYLHWKIVVIRRGGK